MVTHDQSLKHYAHRVVHMVDGKVLRIEVIGEEERRRADAELQEKVEGIQGDRKDKEQREERGEVSEGVTELRDTDTFYDYIRQQEVDVKERERKEREKKEQASRRAAPAGTYAVLPGVSAVVSDEDEGGRARVHIQTSM